ncbi:uncharacterized protein VICG_01017 [Vittaforma corneae ATCC 50505]|uniref:Uncharacterized protein n=1 Tax=Vittaforma corneae (strain ATCC 50505) TaxID=993615 RepID=L2GNC3_VITCO|nr:uncharacterized protein VICG_01017 [Vittaforma corneae ATCC 50505]ELA42000.1 hypothetical protein VICG_01017 [Vittaforma corneae ATCC 50505]
MSTEYEYLENEQLKEALKRYEDKREEVYKELEIAFVQQKVRSKILKKETPGVEILFFDSSNALGEENFENLISESAENESIENASLSNNEDPLDDKVISIASELSEIYEDKYQKEQQPARTRLCDYLDLEAEYSGDENEEESKDQDLSEIIDNTVDNKIKLDHFLNEQRENDEKVLRKLKEKFVRKDRAKVSHEFELLEFESNDEFPEIEEFKFDQNEVVDDPSNIEDVSLFTSANLNRKVKIDPSNVFNNADAVIQKLTRKEETKNTGFIEKSHSKMQ